jgi:hypothetical protein
MVHEKKMVGILDLPALHKDVAGRAWHRRFDVSAERVFREVRDPLPTAIGEVISDKIPARWIIALEVLSSCGITAIISEKGSLHKLEKGPGSRAIPSVDDVCPSWKRLLIGLLSHRD